MADADTTPKTYWMRNCHSKLIPGRRIQVFALGHYKKYDEGEDQFSKVMNGFYRHGYSKDVILKQLVDMWKTHFEDDTVKWDMITVYPRHVKDELNSNMVALAKEFARIVGVEYRQIIIRNKTIKPSHELHSVEERNENVKDSIDIIENINGKNLIVLDNCVVSGISLIHAESSLTSAGANIVIGFCMGLSEQFRQGDFDLNRKIKFSRIQQFKGGKVEKADRIKRPGD